MENNPVQRYDNIIVLKSASPNLPGDFAGGIIQVNLKEVTSNFISAGIGSGWGTISTARDFKLVHQAVFPSTFPSTYLYRVSNNVQKEQYTSLIKTPPVKKFTSFPNLNSSFTVGNKRGKLGILFNTSFRNNYTLNYIDRLDYQSSSELAYKYKDTVYTNTSLLNSFLNLTYLGENKYTFKTNFNRQIDRSYLTRSGLNYDNVQQVSTTSTNNIIKTFLNSQIEAKIKSWDAQAGFNLMVRDQPDYRVTPKVRSLGTEDLYTVAWRDTYRFWSDMNEESFNLGLSKELSNFKVGANYLQRGRAFKARIFRYQREDLLEEITNNTDRYTANFFLGSSFIQYDNQFKKLKVSGGLRSEYNIFDLYTADFSGQRLNVNRVYLDILPSINLSYSLDKVKYRFSASKTLARPEFREVANFAYYDFVRNAQLLGNPNLKKTDIYNLDLKWEYYPKAGENISVSLFGKQFTNPIEQIVADGSVPSNLLLTFSNPKKAVTVGIEVEVRKNVTKWLEIYTNSSLIHSQVTGTGLKRRLQGQSDYVVNSGVNIHKNKNTFNVSYNRTGDRISAVGFQGYSDIFENSRDVVDVVYLRKAGKGEIKLAISDILAQPSIYYQKSRGDLIKTNNEQTISLSLNFNL